MNHLININFILFRFKFQKTGNIEVMKLCNVQSTEINESDFDRNNG